MLPNEALDAARLKRKMTKTDVGRRCGLSTGAISDVFYGRRPDMRALTLVKVAEAMGYVVALLPVEKAGARGAIVVDAGTGTEGES